MWDAALGDSLSLSFTSPRHSSVTAPSTVNNVLWLPWGFQGLLSWHPGQSRG